MWCSKENERGWRDMVTEELRRMEEERRVSVAVGQPQQGAWTTREAVKNRQVNCKPMDNGTPEDQHASALGV